MRSPHVSLRAQHDNFTIIASAPVANSSHFLECPAAVTRFAQIVDIKIRAVMITRNIALE